MLSRVSSKLDHSMEGGALQIAVVCCIVLQGHCTLLYLLNIISEFICSDDAPQTMTNTKHELLAIEHIICE